MSSPSDANIGLPGVHERLVTPETPYEMHDGKRVRVPPADPAHATFHAKLIALLEAHVADGFMVAVDMLTRTSQIDDIAPDASVFPREPDPRTGRRQLEHLAFEIVSTQSMGNAGRKAAKLAGRGVRRVFAIDVERGRVLEWSRELANWSILDADASIEGLALAVPLPIAALVQVSKTDNAVAEALVARRNPVIEAVRLEGREEGREEARLEALLAVLASRGLHTQPGERERILRERDPERIDRWLARVALCASVADLLAT
jgi:hypothetical protein